TSRPPPDPALFPYTTLFRSVIEAFSNATPLVATSVALCGLDVCDKEHVLIANTPVDFANAINDLLADVDLRQRIGQAGRQYVEQDRKSTRLNSSHVKISYAV